MSTNASWMRAAIFEAIRARGRTWPNPIVGALVIRNGKVIGRGYHEKAGAPHAEVVALREAGSRARGAELFVTLEPCNHTGRTPPCTEAILAAGISRVHIGSRDPNRHVRGGGAKRLQEAGVEVESKLLADECDLANQAWLKMITTGRPWVLLKAAATLDGKLATASGDSRWVTGALAREHVHHLRDQLDAVLVGINTVRADDPQLNVRLQKAIEPPAEMVGVPIFGMPINRAEAPRDPVRVVLDARAEMPPRARMLVGKSLAPTILATTDRAAKGKLLALEKAGAEILLCKFDRRGKIQLGDLLDKLGARGLTSLLVEGGAKIHGSFLREDLWDELQLFLAPKLAGEGSLSWAGFPGAKKMSDALALGPLQIDAKHFAPDLLILARRLHPRPV